MDISNWPRQIRDRYVHAPDGIPTDDVSKVAEEIAWFIEQAIAQHGGKMDQNIDITQNVEKLRALVQERGGRIERLERALRRLSFAAQTTGGTAGRDDELVAAIAQADEALADDGGNKDTCPKCGTFHAHGMRGRCIHGCDDTPPQHREAGDALQEILSDKDAMLGVADRAAKRQEEMMSGRGEALEAPYEVVGYVNQPAYEPGGKMAQGERIIGVRIKMPEWEPGEMPTPAPVSWLKGLVEGWHVLTAPPTVPEAVRRLLDEWRRQHGIVGYGYAAQLEAALAQHSEPGRDTTFMAGGVKSDFLGQGAKPHKPGRIPKRLWARDGPFSDMDYNRVYACGWNDCVIAATPDADERE